MQKRIRVKDIDSYEKRQWLRMINCLSGFKSANLIGTVSKEGLTNLSVVSSVVHLGANPPLMAFVLRPHSPDSPRHTYLNIQEIPYFTINHIREDFYKQAHQTSARYNKEESEFVKCGLTEEFKNAFQAPYVQEANIQIGLVLKEVLPITHNNTQFIIGEIVEFYAPESSFKKDGFIDIESAGSLCVSGLDRYHKTKSIDRLTYAKPNQEVRALDLDGDI